MDTIILALGNPLRGDDGAGQMVLEALSAWNDLPAGVELIDGGTAGLETVLLMDGCRRVIIVDAAEMGRQPGEWARFTPDEAALAGGSLADAGTLHAAGLGEALALGAALGRLPEEIVIYGIQPAEIDWKPGLSETVLTAAAAVASAISAELDGLTKQ
jgi:hydrogenase maturation protease